MTAWGYNPEGDVLRLKGVSKQMTCFGRKCHPFGVMDERLPGLQSFHPFGVCLNFIFHLSSFIFFFSPSGLGIIVKNYPNLFAQ